MWKEVFKLADITIKILVKKLVKHDNHQNMFFTGQNKIQIKTF